MALLFCDSFSGYATADLPTRWAGGVQSTPAINNTIVPPGSQAGTTVLDCTTSAGVYSNNYGAAARYIIAFDMYRNSTTGGGIVCGIMNTVGIGNNEGSCYLQMTSTGTFITDGLNNILATGPIVPYHEWHHFEIDIQQGLAGAANIRLYKDGNPAPFLSALAASTTYAVSQYYFLGRTNATGGPATAQDNCIFASHYAFNGSAQTVGPYNFAAPLAPQGFGAAKMAFSVATAPGIVSDWTANGAATIWQSIDQIPQDGDTTYASDATPGDQYQCVFGALPAMQTLIAVQLSTYARTDDAGPRAYQSGFWKGGTFGYSGVDQFLGGTYNYIEDEFTANPITGLAWVPADLTGLEFGAKLTV